MKLVTGSVGVVTAKKTRPRAQYIPVNNCGVDDAAKC